jgi:hypothetical protein
MLLAPVDHRLGRAEAGSRLRLDLPKSRIQSDSWLVAAAERVIEQMRREIPALVEIET